VLPVNGSAVSFSRIAIPGPLTFFEEFARSFNDADLVLLHRVYSAGEKPLEGITSEALARASAKN